MNELSNIKKAKLTSLIHAFRNLGYDISTKIGQNEFRHFLNKRTSSGYFDPILCEKLFQVLNIGPKTKIEISSFIEGFLIFDDEITRNAEAFKIKLAKEKEIYNKLLKQCKLYKSEKLNSEGFCKNAKIYGKITDIDIRKKLQGIKEIVLLVIFNNNKEELHFKIGDESPNIKKSFEFKPTSRKDHFEFIMKGINTKGKEFDIGSKIFPLTEIDSQEEYLVQILIPEINKPNQIAGFIKANIVLYMSDFQYYEKLREKQEKILNQYKKATNKAFEYLKYVREIYGDLSLIKPELIVDFNNEKLMKRKGVKLNVNIENEFIDKNNKGNYLVEYNNEIKIIKNSVPLEIEFNNSKQNNSQIFETKKIEYKYNNLIKKNIEKKEEENNNLIPNKEKENINKNIIPKIQEKFEIKTDKETEQINNIKINTNDNIKDTKDTPQNLNNLNIIKEKKEKSSADQQILSQPDLEKILKNQKIGKLNLKIMEIPITKNAKYISKSPKSIRNNNLNLKNNVINSYSNKNIFTKLKSPEEQYQNNNIPKNIQINNELKNHKNIIKNYSQNINNTKIIEQNKNINNKIIEQNNNILINNPNINSPEFERASIYQIIGDISKKKTLTTQAQTLKPIINKVNYNVSVNKAIINETTSKTLITENTLPVSYLPEKVNKIIISGQVTYLPLATAEKKITYATTTPLINESQIYLKNDNEINFSNLNNFSFGKNFINNNNIVNISNNNNTNQIINYSNNIQNIQGYNNSYINYDNNINKGNNYNYNIDKNFYQTARTSHHIIKTKKIPLENNFGFNYQIQSQVKPINQSHQIYYGI